jgi:altronate dehydratase small subunit
MYIQDDLFIMNEKDDVGVAKKELKKGDHLLLKHTFVDSNIKVNEAIPSGFKVALRFISKGEIVRKYGEPIGKASCDIQQGDLVHVHNLEGLRGRGDVE